MVFELQAFARLAFPAAIGPTLDRVKAMGEEALVSLDQATESVAAGHLAAGQPSLDEGFDRLVRTQTAWAIAGARCALADPQRVSSADLTVPLEMAPWQITAGFGSLWVSELLSDHIVRLDPKTGEVIARITVGEDPVKAQPADDSCGSAPGWTE